MISVVHARNMLVRGSLLLCYSLFFISINTLAVTPTTSLQIVASIRPLALMANQLQTPLQEASLSLNVSTLLPQGTTPHDYNIKPSDIKRILNADLVIWLGATTEPYLSSIIKRVDQQKVIDVSQLTELQRLAIRPLLSEHSHEEDNHEHHNTPYDPHLWWSVNNAKKITGHLLDTLLKTETLTATAKTAVTQSYQITEQTLQQQLQVKRTEFAAQQLAFILLHDGLAYLENDLGINSKARVARGSDHHPGIKTLLALKQRIADQHVVCVVAEPNTSLAIITKIQGNTPLRPVIIDTLGWDADNYGEMLLQAYQKLLSCHR